MYQYSVKIKKNPTTVGFQPKTYIWGGEGVNFNLKSPLYLIIRVPETTGEEIQIKTENKDETSDKDIGTLKEGEVYIIPLNDIKGVYATCNHDTRIDCSIECVSIDSLIPSLE